MLGQSGSTPLDLFWDMVEEEERALRGRRNDVLDVLDVSICILASICVFTNSLRINATKSPRRLPLKILLQLCPLIAAQHPSTTTSST
jgi:hypothetical protein